jgi:uncharacterized protein
MQPRLDVLTLGVPDLDAARRFYVDGLGWEPLLEVPGEIVFVQVGHGRLLALWRADALETDIFGDAARGGHPPPGAGVSLGHNVDSEDEVRRVVERAAAAGATVLKPPQRATEFGGYHGYFADPAGFRWDVVHNPGFSVDGDGRVRLGAGDG